MIKKMFKTVRGFSPLELVIIVGISAFVAGAFILISTVPSKQLAQVCDKASATSCDLTRLQVANADFGDTNPNPENITLSDGSTPAVGGGTELEIWVFPTADENTDPFNIQWAVNNISSGGKVLLKAGPTFFNFGNTDGSIKDVDITVQDVIISGEPGSVIYPEGNANRTVIVGGGANSWMYTPEDRPFGVFNIEAKRNVTVENLHFDSSHGSSVSIFEAGPAINIRSTVHTNIIPVRFYEVHGSSYYHFSVGFGADYAQNQNAELDGSTINIENNVFRWGKWKVPAGSDLGYHGAVGSMWNDDSYALNIKNNRTFGYRNAVFLSNLAGADIVVSGNEFTNGRQAVHIWYDTWRFADKRTPSHKSFEISSNTINNYSEGINLWGSYNSEYNYVGRIAPTTIKNNVINGSRSIGIMVNSGISPVIENNQILDHKGSIMSGQDFWASGINVFGTSSATITGNKVTQLNSYDAVPSGILFHSWGLAAEESGGLVKDNVLTGNYNVGLFTQYLPDVEVKNNDLKQVVAGQAQLYVGEGTDNSTFTNNDYGSMFHPFGMEMAGAEVYGSGNTFTNENFHGDYGWGYTDASGEQVYFDANGDPVGIGAIVFAEGATGNKVTALKNGNSLNGFALCSNIVTTADYDEGGKIMYVNGWTHFEGPWIVTNPTWGWSQTEVVDYGQGYGSAGFGEEGNPLTANAFQRHDEHTAFVVTVGPFFDGPFQVMQGYPISPIKTTDEVTTVGGFSRPVPGSQPLFGELKVNEAPGYNKCDNHTQAFISAKQEGLAAGKAKIHTSENMELPDLTQFEQMQ